MGDGSPGIKVISDHFEASTSSVESPQTKTPSTSHPVTDNSSSIAPIAVRGLDEN